MEKTIKSIAELEEFAGGFVGELSAAQGGATVVGLSGDLGSGKTAFVKAVARVLGIAESVLSPTFVIAKFYDIHGAYPWSKLVHVDAYRIENAAELTPLHWDTLIADPRNLVFVEWPEYAGTSFPKDAATLTFRFINETTRVIC